MTRKAIIDQTIDTIKKLPDDKIQEISNFVSFIFKQYEEDVLSKGIQKLSVESKSFDFLNDEEELYTVEDLKEVYNG